MPKETVRDLKKFLAPYSPKVRELAFSLRSFVWDLYPRCNELIYDNYNAVAFGWSTSDRLKDTFCSIAALPSYVHFGFYWGNRLSDPEKILSGKGNQYRYIRVAGLDNFPTTYIKKLLREAYSNSIAALPGRRQTIKSATIVKSVSPRKKRPSKK